MQDIESQSIEPLVKVIITEDGSSSLIRKDLQEGYHSHFGALAESKHIFIEAGLKELENKSKINLLEIGFGTGLNALLSLEYANKENQSIFYQTIEKHPLSQTIIAQLNYGELLSKKEEFNLIHSCKWNEPTLITPYFSLHKIKSLAQTLNYKPNFFDIIYFDAFAPQFETQLWNKELFTKLYQSLVEKGILVTYCCKGEVKRILKEIGFIIEKLPGPKGKREILRARKSIK